MIILMIAMFISTATTAVYAQGVVMNSAETIKVKNFKFAVFPTMLFSKNGSDSEFGVAGRFGFGFTPRLDIEAKAAFFDGLTYFGVDVEYWLIKERKFNASIAVGGHMTKSDVGPDSSGIDTTFLISTKPANKLEIYGGLKLAFDSYKNIDWNYTLAHVVPGIEYRISRDLDFVAEVGIALNENSRSYASAGFAFYLTM
jgi:hypothetical protein